MHRRERLRVETLENLGRLEHLAHDEAGDRLRFRPHDQEADDRLDHPRQQVARRRRVQRSGRGRSHGWPERAADRRDDVIGAGEPQALLAAEVVGDAGEIGPRRRRDGAGRSALETLGAEQVERSVDQRQARGVAAAFALIGSGFSLRGHFGLCKSND